MKVSQLLGATRRESPSNTDLNSFALLERAGYVRQLASGIFSYLHLGNRSIRKIEQILREEMDRIGGLEINMPLVHPSDIWKKTGRYDSIDDSLVRFQDRNSRDLVLAMTHEEVVSTLANQEISSYRQLPVLVYQIQTKFRDELRPRAGLIRAREFIMKDSYSLDIDNDGLNKQYIRHYNAYYRMFARMGLPVVAILSDVGMMGGSMAHEYMYLTEIGEDTIYICNNCGYKANKEIGKFAKSPEPGTGAEMEKVHTPNTSTIENLANYLRLEKSDLGKMVFYVGTIGDTEKLVACVVPGDLEVNQMKLSGLLECGDLRAALPDEIKQAGGVPGFASPIGMDPKKTLIVADDLVAAGKSYVLGANELDYHCRNVECGRDYQADITGDIVSAYEGAPCVRCQQALSAMRGVETGNIFQLGTKYSSALDALYKDPSGKDLPIIMGSYGIGVGRALACVAEEYNDDKGLKLPISIAPYQVILIAIIDTDQIAKLADEVYQEFLDKGIEVLYDDRTTKVASPGVKFKDTDLYGIPIRITISKRSLEQGGLELKLREEEDSAIYPRSEISNIAQEKIGILFKHIDDKVKTQPVWEFEKEFWEE